MRWHVGCCPFGLIAKTYIHIKKMQELRTFATVLLQ